MPSARPGPGTLWIGVELPQNEKLHFDKNGRPTGGAPLEISVISASATTNKKNGTMLIEATIDQQGLAKIKSVARQIHIGSDPSLPSGAQDFVEMPPAEQSSIQCP